MDKRILIIKQLTGDISLAERAQLKDWLEESPEHVNIRNQIRSDWRLSKEAKEPVTVEVEKNTKAIQELIITVKEERSRAIDNRKKQTKPALKSREFSLIPLLLGLGVIAGLFFVYKFFPKNTESPKIEKRLTSMLGEIRSHVLPDDSKIWLNAESELRYIEEGPEVGQSIFFNGEGYFEITAKENLQSVIRLPKMIVKANYAHFNISEKEKVTSAQIHVISGKLSIHALDGGLVTTLISGQAGRYIYTEKKFEQDTNFNPNVTSWKSKKLVFNKVPLGQVIADVETYFDRKILLEKKALKSCLFSGTFENPDINRMLSNLASKYGMQFTQGGHGDYILRRGTCQ